MNISGINPMLSRISFGSTHANGDNGTSVCRGAKPDEIENIAAELGQSDDWDNDRLGDSDYTIKPMFSDRETYEFIRDLSIHNL